MSMKKTTVGILTSIIVVSAGTASVFAAGQAKGRNFIDVDGNGICNNAKVVCSYVDEDQNILNQQQKSASISIHLWSWNLIDLIVCSQWKVNDQIQSKEVLNHIKGCTNKSENIYCYYIKAEEVENAHEAGFSCGKYKVFLEIQELDPRITAKEVKNMSMKEMRDLLKELSGTDQEKPEPHEKRKRHGKCK